MLENHRQLQDAKTTSKPGEFFSELSPHTPTTEQVVEKLQHLLFLLLKSLSRKATVGHIIPMLPDDGANPGSGTGSGKSGVKSLFLTQRF